MKEEINKVRSIILPYGKIEGLLLIRNDQGWWTRMCVALLNEDRDSFNESLQVGIDGY